MALTTAKIEAARPGITPDGRRTPKPYKLGDAGGLYLQVPPTGSKRWRLKYRFAGREKGISLGVYPEVSLTQAREKRDFLRALLAAGTDPSEHVKRERTEQRDAQARQLAAMRFMLDDQGALSFRLGSRRLFLTPTETKDLRRFLDATRDLVPKE